jgi:hypothetical protein
MHHQDAPQCQRRDAEVLTTAFTAAFFLRGNLESARWMLKQPAYIPQMLSKRRCSRRLHRLKEPLMLLVKLFGHVWKTLNRDSIYVIESLPISACDHLRIKHAKLYTDECFRGYIASKKR